MGRGKALTKTKALDRASVLRSSSKCVGQIILLSGRNSAWPFGFELVIVIVIIKNVTI